MHLSFDEIARTFDDQRGLPPDALRALVTCIDEISAGRVLDIIEPGIGTGRVALPLAVSGHHVTGVDISKPMLDACASKAVVLDISERVTLIVGDATDMPCEDDTFDVGVIASLLYLVSDWETVLDELARVVRPGGAVIQLRERTVSGDALTRWDAEWRTRIEQTGFAHQPMSPTDEDVAGAMRRRWPDTEVRSLASWTFGQTVREARDGFGDRLQPLYPGIEEDEWRQVVDGFLGWGMVAFPDSTVDLGGDVVLEAVIGWT